MKQLCWWQCICINQGAWLGSGWDCLQIHVIIKSNSVFHTYTLLGQTKSICWPPFSILHLLFNVFFQSVQENKAICDGLTSDNLPSLFPSHELSTTHALQRETEREREKEPLMMMVILHIPPVNALIVMQPLLVNVGLVTQSFSLTCKCAWLSPGTMLTCCYDNGIVGEKTLNMTCVFRATS